MGDLSPSLASTPIEELIQESDEIVSAKNHALMKNQFSNFFLPFATEIPCWWCREQFETSPIGLPLLYIPQSEKCKKFLSSNGFKTDGGLSRVDEGDYFETDGIFCSFECCKAYISCFSSNYESSSLLLDLLYCKLFNCKEAKIKKAPSWKLLVKWGGTLTYSEFKNSLSTFVFTSNFNRPFMFPASAIVEEYVRRR